MGSDIGDLVRALETETNLEEMRVVEVPKRISFYFDYVLQPTMVTARAECKASGLIHFPHCIWPTFV